MMKCDLVRFSHQRRLKALLASTALLCATPSLAQSIVGTGDVIPAPASPQSSPWLPPGPNALLVGTTSPGSVAVSNGGVVFSGTGVDIGNGSTGAVTVDGGGSQWTTTQGMLVGLISTGTLDITNGGVVTSSGGSVGNTGSGIGTVRVDGSGSRWAAASPSVFSVGLSGTGTMEITNGGAVETSNAQVGSSAGSTGSVTVDGSGSQWTNTNTMFVSIHGTGTLTISNGGTVLAPTVSIAGLVGLPGFASDGTGTVIIGAAAGQAAVAPGVLNAQTVGFGEGTGDLVFNHTSSNYIFAPVITEGTATTSAVDVYAGTTVMTGVGSDYFGRTTIHGGILAVGATHILSANSDYVVQGAGTLDLRGNGQTVGSLANAGLVNMGTGTTPGTVLTVNGNYLGNGGIIAFNTMLGADNSPTDRLVVNGNTSGQTGVRVTNAGGLGAVTTGNGIELVQVGGSSNGQFSLTGRVAAGAFDYSLFQGGIGAAASNGNWYLRSATRPEVPEDVVVPEEASQLGLIVLATASARGSDLGLGTATGGYGYGPSQFCADDVTPTPGLYTKAPPANVACNTLLWGRLFGETGSVGGGTGSNGGFGSAGPAYSFDFGGFQAGADLYRTARDSAGLYASAASMQSDVKMPNGGPAGSVGMDAYGGGGYWTHRYAGGWYTDLVLQGNVFNNIRSRSVDGVSFDTQGWGITASAEAGYALALGDGFTVIPQGQLIYQRTSIDGGADQFGNISYGATDEVYGRLGARFAKGWLINDGRVVTTWAETNFWDQFGGNAKTTFTTLDGTNPATFATNLGGLGSTWAQVRLGVTGQLTHNVSMFGDADYNVALNQPGNSFGGRAGVRVAW